MGINEGVGNGGMWVESWKMIEERGRVIESAARSLVSVVPSLPKEENLAREHELAVEANARGYFLPDEEEAVLGPFGRYTVVRDVLREIIGELEPLVWDFDEATREERMRAFAVAYVAAAMLIRSAVFIVEGYAGLKVVHRKLDQGEPRYGIPPRRFTAIYQSLSLPTSYLRFDVGRRFAGGNWDELMALDDGGEFGEVIELLKREHPLAMEFKKWRRFWGSFSFLHHAARRRRIATLKQVTFSLFEMSGRAIAEMRNPLHVKRVTPALRKEAKGLLRAGDVLITRHDDALSNRFLPGFWPHAALYIGDEEERQGLGIDGDQESGGVIDILEARKDGVLFREIDNTLTVDCFVAIRPMVDDASRGEAIRRAMTHAGKGYDFEFDFARSDRLVCTEVVYRGYHGIGGIEFEPQEHAGRCCLTAEQLLDHAVEGRGFEVVALFGTTPLPEILRGGAASEGLRASYR